MNKRGSGLLIHITSLPSPYGIGDLGPWAGKFVDFLEETKQSYWQILPLNPTDPSLGNSPYSSYSAFAGNPLLINPDLLVDDGFLLRYDIESPPSFSSQKVNYRAVTEYKKRVLLTSFKRYKMRDERDEEFERFCRENDYWLDNYALFISLKENFGGVPWNDWPEVLRDRNENALKEWQERLSDRILREKFFQFLFFKQWLSLRSYANGKNIKIIGDIPIYVSYDSSDVWTNPEIFKLDENKRPAFVAGVPPDYFSNTGQLWGNPVYKWEVLLESGYSWWLRRMEHNLKLFDLVRLDHFRGFVAYWEVAAGEKTSINGRWIEAPVEDFFNNLMKNFPDLSIIAEDLGYITPDVKKVMEHFGFPGMKLLLFAFGDDLATHPYVPHNYIENCVAYTGTHDNNTIEGWFRKEASLEDKVKLFRYMGRELAPGEVHWELIRLAMMSVARMVIIPIQDVLGLGEEARMNLPATSEGNWEWRLLPEQLTPALREKLLEKTETYGRG